MQINIQNYWLFLGQTVLTLDLCCDMNPRMHTFKQFEISSLPPEYVEEHHINSGRGTNLLCIQSIFARKHGGVKI